MNTSSAYSYGLSLIIKRTLEGRVGPLNFILLLGFISSLMLLYISLHFYFYNISEQIEKGLEREKTLTNENVRLVRMYNELSSPERVIPLAKKLGMRASTPNEVERLAVFEEKASDENTPRWARTGSGGIDEPYQDIGRRAR
jgi:cell division protein FtsL